MVLKRKGESMLTDKQEKFVQNIIQGMNQADAYRSAYDARKMSENAIYREASLLMSNPKVTQRLTFLSEKADKGKIMSAQKRLEWLHQHAARFPSGLTKSHKRTLQSLLTGILYGTRTQKDLDILLEERANKESAPKIRDVYQKLYVQMDAILNTPLAVTLQCPGCPDPEDKRERYRLFLDWLELSKRGGYE